ncbi:MAG: hypothetical protein V1781_01215 [Bacteroidota bacterium]
MKKILLTCFLFSIIIKCVIANPNTLIDSANKAYSLGNFQKAAEYYENILTHGFESAEIYFNLGNSYFKTDRIGLSILNYERAKKLSPHDDDIQFNLNLANQRTLDKIEFIPKFFFVEWWSKMKSLHSEKTWTLRSIICFILFFFFLTVFIVSKKSINRQFSFCLGLIFLILTFLTLIIAQDRYSKLTNKDTAIILSFSAEIKNAPAESGTKLFILHEGTKVNVLEINNGWIKVGLSQEKVGWVKKISIEYI